MTTLEPCHMDGCEKPTGIPVAHLGLCRMHYKRYRTWGDPYWVNRRRKVCVIDGCDTFVTARGWCLMHYTRWRRYGNPTHRLRGEVVDGRRICATCREDKPLVDYGSGAWCKECTNRRARDWRRDNPDAVKSQAKRSWESICEHCQTVFVANGKRSRYCSRDCSAARKNIDNWKHMVARRARLRDAWVETFDRTEIFERDSWTCQLCELPIDRTLAFPDPGSPSLDHIVPIARGGTHERANAQASHFGCNMVKGDRLIGAVA